MTTDRAVRLRKPAQVIEQHPGLRDAGALPRLEWVDKSMFVIDHVYQRSVESKASQAVIQHITANFTWARFSPPTVTPAGDSGKFIVIDGQHRIAAARRRPDIGKVPVYIVEGLSQQEQAEAFVGINKDRVALTPLALYRAQIAMGDPAALQIQEVCEEAEVSIAKYPVMNGYTKPRETMALGTIRKGLHTYGEAAVIAGLSIVPDAFKMVPGMMRASILSCLFEFFHVRGVANVDRDVLVRTVKAKDPAIRELEARTVARTEGGKINAHMLDALNADYEKGLQ